jgi:hypothetical protein
LSFNRFLIMILFPFFNLRSNFIDGSLSVTTDQRVFALRFALEFRQKNRINVSLFQAFQYKTEDIRSEKDSNMAVNVIAQLIVRQITTNTAPSHQ